MNAYFLEIAVVRLSARLLGKELIDNYAFFASLPRFSPLKLKAVGEADGIDGVPEKAAIFNFGAACGRAIEKVLGKPSEEESLYINGEIARNLLLDLSPEKRALYTEAEIYASISTILDALVKKAQIRTHTAKPGYEDIDKWLADYYGLQKSYDSYLNSLVGEILRPSPGPAKKYSSFFDKKDPIIALALEKEIKEGALKTACEAEPKSTFGKILLEAVKTGQE